MMPVHWSVLLDGYAEIDTIAGDVITRDGEFIGTWSLVDGVFCTFTPDGADTYIFLEPFVAVLCARIEEWCGGREPSADQTHLPRKP